MPVPAVTLRPDGARRNPKASLSGQQRLRAVEQQEAGKTGQAQGQRDALGVVGAGEGRQVWARWAERRRQDAIETPAGVAGNWYYPKRPFDTDETMHYDLPDLRLVAAIADCGSLTRAAVRIHLAPSSASHRLTQLEAALGMALSNATRAADAHAGWRILLRHARQVFAQLEQMHADLAPYASGLHSQVTVLPTPTPSTASCRKTSAISCATIRKSGSVWKSSPARPSSAPSPPGRSISASSPTKATWPAWKPCPTGATGWCPIVRLAHPLAGEPAVAFARVLAEPFVCLHAGSAIHTFMMNHAAQLGGRLDVRIQVRSFNAVCRMVAAGVGIGMVPRSAVGGGQVRA